MALSRKRNELCLTQVGSGFLSILASFIDSRGVCICSERVGDPSTDAYA